MPMWTPPDDKKLCQSLIVLIWDLMPKKDICEKLSKMMDRKFTAESISHKIRKVLKDTKPGPVKSEPGKTPEASPIKKKPRAPKRKNTKAEDSDGPLTPSPTPQRSRKRKNDSRTPESSPSPDLDDEQVETPVRRFPMRKCPRKSYRIDSEDQSSAHDSGVDAGAISPAIKIEKDESGVGLPKGVKFEEEEMEL
ncbi:hypothetical protein HDK77DRAFT_437491 [Phyllosticta capitalensis]|uniref:uncharacterized protein n=1 Tax=Phyllosticta capitalensis TaxID=121624 RepID=UPI00312E5367